METTTEPRARRRRRSSDEVRDERAATEARYAAHRIAVAELRAHPRRQPDLPMPWGKYKGVPLGALPNSYLRFLTQRADDPKQPDAHMPLYLMAKAEYLHRIEETNKARVAAGKVPMGPTEPATE